MSAPYTGNPAGIPNHNLPVTVTNPIDTDPLTATSNNVAIQTLADNVARLNTSAVFGDNTGAGENVPGRLNIKATGGIFFESLSRFDIDNGCDARIHTFVEINNVFAGFTNTTGGFVYFELATNTWVSTNGFMMDPVAVGANGSGYRYLTNRTVTKLILASEFTSDAPTPGGTNFATSVYGGSWLGGNIGVAITVPLGSLIVSVKTLWQNIQVTAQTPTLTVYKLAASGSPTFAIPYNQTVLYSGTITIPAGYFMGYVTTPMTAALILQESKVFLHLAMGAIPGMNFYGLEVTYSTGGLNPEV